MKTILFFWLITLSAFAQKIASPPTLTYRQSNTNELNMIVSSASQLLTPSNSMSITAEIRASDVGRIIGTVSMSTVSSQDGTIKGILPDLAPNIYYLGLFVDYANGQPDFRVGVARIEILPTGSLRSITDASGLNVQISETKQVLDIKLDATPSASVAAYYAQQARSATDTVVTAVANIHTYANSAANSASAASTSMQTALGYKNSAQVSADSALVRATRTLTARASALLSEQNAKTSELAAQTSLTTVQGMANTVASNTTLVQGLTNSVATNTTLVQGLANTVASNTTLTAAYSSSATLAKTGAETARDLANASAVSAAQSATAAVAAFKGVWTANAVYATGDLVTQGGNTYRRKTAGSAASFDAANWDITAQGGSVADATITAAKLASDIPDKNYPFAPTANTNAILKAAVRDIKLYNHDPSKVYSITVFRKKGTVGQNTNFWEIAIYDWTGGTIGSKTVGWTVSTGYTPSANVETITLTGSNDLSASVTVDWAQVPDGTNLLSLSTISAGINSLCYVRQTDFQAYIDKRILANPVSVGDATVTTAKLASDIPSKNYPFAASSSPNATFKAAIKDVSLYNADPSKQYTVCILRKGATVGANTDFWQVSIYNWTGTAVGTEQAGWVRSTGYTPTNTVETIMLSGSLTAAVTIDWSQVPTNTNFSSVGFTSAGISPLTYKRFTDFQAYVDNRIAATGSVNASTQFDIVLPPKLYMVTGSQYWFYDDAIIRNAHLYERRSMKLGFSAVKTSDGTTLTPAPYDYIYGTGKLASPQSYSLTVNLQDFTGATGATPTVLLSKTIPVTVKTKPTSKTVNALFIGDSYIDAKWGDGVLAYIQQFASADGNTIVYKGSRTSYSTYQTEARASWNENTFMRYVPLAQRIDVNGDPTSPNMHSPFMFSTNDTQAGASFDFGQYLTTYNIGSLDVVVFFLGMNGGQGPNIDVMINSIKAALPSVTILVCMVPGAEKNKYNLNSSTFDSWARQVGRLDQNLSYLTRFANREASNIYLVPTHMNFHRVYALRNQNYEQVQFNLDSVGQVPVNIDHHPSPSGAKGLGYMIYNHIMYLAP